MNYICHSGGCPGADMTWENECLKYGIKTISYSFWNHKQEGRNPKILTVEELKEGFEHVLKANETLKRDPSGQAQYVKNLLARNWFQVKNSEAVFAVGKMTSDKLVSGGTGWAVQMAIDNRKPVYIFDQNVTIWYRYQYDIINEGFVANMQSKDFNEPLTNIPTLTENFAGIGTREINQSGIAAIQEILKTHRKPQQTGSSLLRRRFVWGQYPPGAPI